MEFHRPEKNVRIIRSSGFWHFFQIHLIPLVSDLTGHENCRNFYQVLTYCKRACGLGSQCRPNECIFGSGKLRGVGISGGRVYKTDEGMEKLVYEQPGNEVDGSCHNKEGSK